MGDIGRWNVVPRLTRSRRPLSDALEQGLLLGLGVSPMRAREAAAAAAVTRSLLDSFGAASAPPSQTGSALSAAAYLV